LHYDSGKVKGPSMSLESEWVVIHGWTECSVKCGGGF